MTHERGAREEMTGARPYRIGLRGLIKLRAVEADEELTPTTIANYRDFINFGIEHEYDVAFSSRCWGQLVRQFAVAQNPEHFERYNRYVPLRQSDFVVRFQTFPEGVSPSMTIHQYEQFITDLEVESLAEYVAIIDQLRSEHGDHAYKVLGKNTGPKIAEFWRKYTQWALNTSAKKSSAAA